MILLDTHVWVWWVHGSEQLHPSSIEFLDSQEDEGLGVSVFSCWEVAKLVEYKRLELAEPIGRWMETALEYPGVQCLPLTPKIAVESTQLPGAFHRDPADQLIVATARVHQIPLATTDGKILDYEGVETVFLR